MKLRKGDSVKIMTGKDRGKIGKVLTAYPEGEKVTIEGINLFKKRSRPKSEGQKGQTVLLPRPMDASKVMLICTNCKNPTRTGSRMDGAKRVRYCKKCQATN